MTTYKIKSYEEKDDMFRCITDHPDPMVFVYPKDMFANKAALEQEINKKIKEIEKREKIKKDKIDNIKAELTAIKP